MKGQLKKYLFVFMCLFVLIPPFVIDSFAANFVLIPPETFLIDDVTNGPEIFGEFDYYGGWQSAGFGAGAVLCEEQKDFLHAKFQAVFDENYPLWRGFYLRNNSDDDFILSNMFHVTDYFDLFNDSAFVKVSQKRLFVKNPEQVNVMNLDDTVANMYIDNETQAVIEGVTITHSESDISTHFTIFESITYFDVKGLVLNPYNNDQIHISDIVSVDDPYGQWDGYLESLFAYSYFRVDYVETEEEFLQDLYMSMSVYRNHGILDYDNQELLDYFADYDNIMASLEQGILNIDLWDYETGFDFYNQLFESTFVITGLLPLVTICLSLHLSFKYLRL